MRRFLKTISLFVVLSVPLVSSAHALSIFHSEKGFLELAPVVSTETFDEYPSGTKIAESAAGSSDLCTVEAIVDDVVYSLQDLPGEESCWWRVKGNSDGPPPVTQPNILSSSGIGGPYEGSVETISFGFDPRSFVKAIGFYFHSVISAEFLNTNNPEFLGWQIIVTEINGEKTTINTDAYLGAGPTPPYFGFLSESGIKDVEIRDYPGDGLAVNWGYDNVSRSEIMLAETVVAIDVKPGNKQNIINPRAKGVIWVAILSDTDPDTPFDPSSQVVIPTVEFGPDGAKAKRHKVKDINKDGIGDLLLRFKIQNTGIACGDTEATLTGKTFDGQHFTGTDSIKTVGCDKK